MSIRKGLSQILIIRKKEFLTLSVGQGQILNKFLTNPLLLRGLGQIRSMLRFYWVSLTAVITLLTYGVIVNTKALWLTLLHLEILILLLKQVPMRSSTVLSENKMCTRNKLVGWNNGQNDTSQVIVSLLLIWSVLKMGTVTWI